MQFITVKNDKPDATNFILGQTHFIKTVEDIHEAHLGAVPGIKFGLGFCEASGACLVRWSGTDAGLEELARRGVNELHVEAGFRLNGSLVREGCVDEFVVYLNPSFLGDAAQGMLGLPEFASLESRLKLKVLALDRCGEDLRIVARPA